MTHGLFKMSRRDIERAWSRAITLGAWATANRLAVELGSVRQPKRHKKPENKLHAPAN